MEVDGAPVLSSQKGVLAGVTPVRLRDCEAVQLSDGGVAEPLLHW